MAAPMPAVRPPPEARARGQRGSGASEWVTPRDGGGAGRGPGNRVPAQERKTVRGGSRLPGTERPIFLSAGSS
ncbi:hypothetical protein GCM10023082_41050 [Streptomyces tremellae]|uniref:Uncharacterized protein n=1 Tax=Streptomyces tremellae TaxID=1124239 RepID=A0ABP7FH46_9ACTN